MRLLLAASSFAIAAAACSPAPAPAPSPSASVAAAPTEQPTTPEPAPTVAPIVAEGWTTDPAQAPMIGQAAPTIDVPGSGTASALKSETLRGKWTILAFWTSGDAASKADIPYIEALDSAAGQDPDLEFASISKGEPSSPMPTRLYVDRDGALTAAFGATTPPHYVLLDPDLVVRGVRGKFAGTQEDGIKGAIKGVAEIRKAVGK